MNPDLAFARGGHENHLRAINTIRAAGGIAAAVQKEILMRGVMHACVRHDVDIVLTGAIRDEGPIPGVTTDVIEAQKVMRQKLADVTHVMLLATVQHSLAVASMLAPRQKQYASISIRLQWSARSNISPYNQSAWSRTWNRFCESSPTILVSLAFASKLAVLCASYSSVRRIITASSTRSIPG